MFGSDDVQGARMPLTVTLTFCGASKRPGWYVTVSVPTHNTSAETAWAAVEGNTTPLITSAATASKVQRRITRSSYLSEPDPREQDLYCGAIVRSRGGLANSSCMSGTSGMVADGNNAKILRC